MTKHRWKGELAKPIRPKVIRPRGLRVTADTVAAANREMDDLYRKAIEKEYLAKLILLMDEYGIADKTDFFSLALALAIEHIPGFKIDPTPLRLEQIDDQGVQLVVQDNREGRPPEWPLKRLNNLLSAVGWCRDLCWNWVTRSPAFREYRVRPRRQLADRWWQASANRQPFAC